MTDARTMTSSLRGRWHGRYGMVRCPCHKDRKPSLSICDGPNGLMVNSMRVAIGAT